MPVIIGGHGRKPFPFSMRKAAQWAAKAAEIAQQIAAGHAYKDHVLKQEEFPWIESRGEFADFIEGIIRKPTARKSLKDGRTGFWDGKTGTIVIHNPRDPDGGTAYRSTNSKRDFNRLR